MTSTELTVHHLTSAASSSLSSLSTFLIDAGRAAASSALSSEGWLDVPMGPSPADLARFNNPRNAFVYAGVPPVVARAAWRTPLKEWGEAVDDEEIFVTRDLLEFEGIEALPPASQAEPRPRLAASIASGDVSLRDKRVQSQEETHLASPPPPKRRKLDEASLFTVIPPPHFLPHPVSGYVHAPTAVQQRPQPWTPLPPHDPASAQALLDAPYARCAWLIPLRGAPPWPGSSRACLVGDPPDETRAPDADAQNEHELVWTRAAVSALWKSLLALRAAGELGPLSLSFRPADPPSLFRAVDGGPAQVVEEGRRGRGRAMDEVDFVKITVDAPFALHVREALRAWIYTCETDGDALGIDRPTDKSYILSKAQLVLVDEGARGVLIC